MKHATFLVALVGWASWLFTGSLWVAGAGTVLLLLALTFTAAKPWRFVHRRKRWSWGGGIFIPPFYIGGHRRGDDQQ